MERRSPLHRTLRALARPATIPRARAAKTEQKANSYHFQPWDNHSNLKTELRTICGQVDQPSAALILDLKQRGLLEDVIVMWTGEFGRLPITEGADGRDHNRHAFSLLLGGGGFKGGHIHGATDDFGYKSVLNRVSVPDLHATILHLLGLDHIRLTYLHNGRPERLTGPEVTGVRIVPELLVSDTSSFTG